VVGGCFQNGDFIGLLHDLEDVRFLIMCVLRARKVGATSLGINHLTWGIGNYSWAILCESNAIHQGEGHHS